MGGLMPSACLFRGGGVKPTKDLDFHTLRRKSGFLASLRQAQDVASRGSE